MNNITGQRFSRLLAISFVGKIKRRPTWLFKCDCGNECQKVYYDVIRGFVKSCGCLKSEVTAKRNKSNSTHGLSQTRTYRSWCMAANRCYNKNIKTWFAYGAIGIVMCEYLRSGVLNLIECIGERPEKTSLDRINNSGSYTCGKCPECITNGWVANIRWASAKTQGRNQKTNHLITIGQETKCMAQWADDYGINYDCLRARIDRGIIGSDLLAPIRNRKR